jgi:4-amino-4-deoxy-L-arabinose transferase-like glycosyltransferase
LPEPSQDATMPYSPLVPGYPRMNQESHTSSDNGPRGARSPLRASPRTTLLCLALMFLAAFSLRAWGARFGLPEYVYHPDEHAIVERASSILRTGDYSPHWFNYPSAYIYLQTLAYIPYFLVSAARGFGNAIPVSAPYGFYFAGRLLTALVGAVTVPAVYLLGSKAFDRRTGLVSSALLALNLLHVVHSHYVTTDVPVAFFVTLSLLFSCQLLDTRQTKYTILAGLCAGLAASTKYPGAVALLPVLLAQILVTGRQRWEDLSRRLGLSLGVFVGGFLLGTPYAFLELHTFLSSLASVVGHYGTSQPGFEGSWSALWYVRQVLSSADLLFGMLALLGLLWALLRRRKADLLLLSFVVPYYLLFALWRVRFERNLIALVPLLAILGARFVVDAVSWLGRRRPGWTRWEVPVLACLTALVIVLPAKAAVDFDHALSERDHRTLAAEWVNANVPARSKVVTEAFSIPLDEERFEVLELVRIDSHELQWYVDEGVEYVVVSDGHWPILFEEPERYAREIVTYNEILAHSSMLQEFPGMVPPLLSRGYPTIPVYHFPDVLILYMD